MPHYLNPSELPQPGGRYAQGVLVDASARRLIMSGQVGCRRDGSIADGLSAQTEQIFDNIEALLAAAGMDLGHIVKLTIFCADPNGAAVIRDIRNRRLGNHTPASTFLHVAGLANPAYLVEIEGEAIGSSV